MKYKFFALAFIFVLSGIGAVSAQTKVKNQLAAQLPASDGVVSVDVQRILTESAPQILAGKPQMLADINAGIDKIREKTGLDARQFEQIVIGVAMKQVSAREIDLEPVFLARGKYNAASLIAIAKIASNGKYREERIGNRTVYVFTGREVVAQNKPRTKNSWLDKLIDRMVNSLTKEIAVTTLDGNTLAFGSLARVRATFETKERVSNEVLSLASRKPNAVISFGAKLPAGLSQFLDLGNDELGQALDSIRQVSGAIETTADSTGVSLTAKTLTAEQAQTLHENLEAIQMVGKALIGGKSEEKKVYTRLIDAARITRNQSEVSLDLQAAQSDINILLAGIK